MEYKLVINFSRLILGLWSIAMLYALSLQCYADALVDEKVYEYKNSFAQNQQKFEYQELIDQLIKSKKSKLSRKLEKSGLLLNKTFKDTDFECNINYISVDPSGSSRLAMCGGYYSTLILDANSGKVLKNLDVASSIRKVRFDPNGKMLATATINVDIYDLTNYKKIYSFKGHDKSVIDLKFNRSGNLLVTFGWDDRMNLWDMKTGWHIWEKQFPKFWIRKEEDTLLAFTPDNNLLVFFNGKTIYKLSIKTGELLSQVDIQRPYKEIFFIELSPDGKLIAETSLDSTIKIYNTTTGSLVHTLRGHKMWVDSMKFSSDVNTLYTVSEQQLIVWDVKSGTKKKSWIPTGQNDRLPANICITPDNKYLVLIDTGQTVRAWDITKIK